MRSGSWGCWFDSHSESYKAAGLFFHADTATPPAAWAYLLQQDEIVGVDIEMSTRGVTSIHSDLVQSVKLSPSTREPSAVVKVLVLLPGMQF